MLEVKNSGKNVRLFGFKVEACFFGLKISVFETKRGPSNIRRRMLKIQRCQFEIQRSMFEVGGYLGGGEGGGGDPLGSG